MWKETYRNKFSDEYTPLIGNQFEIYDIVSNKFVHASVISVDSESNKIIFKDDDTEYSVNENMVNFDHNPFWMRKETKTDCYDMMCEYYKQQDVFSKEYECFYDGRIGRCLLCSLSSKFRHYPMFICTINDKEVLLPEDYINIKNDNNWFDNLKNNYRHVNEAENFRKENQKLIGAVRYIERNRKPVKVIIKDIIYHNLFRCQIEDTGEIEDFHEKELNLLSKFWLCDILNMSKLDAYNMIYANVLNTPVDYIKNKKLKTGKLIGFYFHKKLFECIVEDENGEHIHIIHHSVNYMRDSGWLEQKKKIHNIK